MMKKNKRLLNLAAMLLLCAGASPAWSHCTKPGSIYAGDTASARISFGKINLTDVYLQPVGTLLASTVVPPTSYTYGSLSPGTVIWECDAADLPNIHFLIATNGDDRVGGYWDIGHADGLSGVYATWFGYTGIRLTMAGVQAERVWKAVPVTSYNLTTGATPKVQIRLQDIPPLFAELYRVSALPPTSGSASAYCGTNNNDGSGIGLASAAGRNYTCNQPNAYIQLSGTTAASFSYPRDMAGEDSYNHYDFWSAYGIGYGMYQTNTFYQAATCVARSATPTVLFPLITATRLNSGGSTSASVNVVVECSDAAVSGIDAGQTAIGIQASPAAYSHAQTLGLVNASGGVKALVSDNYSGSEMAHGVGITLSNGSQEMLFVGQPGTVSLSAPGGNDAGWYPVLDGATPSGSAASGYTTYTHHMIATLKALDGHTATPGKVYATASVLVKMQ